MPLVAHPRRLILALLIILGLGLRLWGLWWGLAGGGEALHPGEWVWQIIDSLSFDNPSYRGIWTQTFFSLAALIMGAVNTVAAWVMQWLGDYNHPEALLLSARMAGRLTVALMGAAQVGLAYLLGRRLFESVGAGLMAAALVAVSPLLVAHGHFLSLDAPLGLMVLLCLWITTRAMDDPRAGGWVLVGLALGLTITTKASGIVMAPLALVGYLAAARANRPGKLRSLFLWPLALLAGTAVGLILGYPGFVIDLQEASQVVYQSVDQPPGVALGLGAYAAQRARECLAVFTQAIGWEFAVLWLAGLALIVRAKRPAPWLTAAFPLLYLPLSLVLLTGSVESLQAVWVPAALVVAAWPLVALCRRLPGYWTPVAAAVGLGLLVCAFPLWRSLGVNYLFWSPESRTLAKAWIEDNLPDGARVLLGSGHLFQVGRPARPLEQVTDWSQLKTLGGYAVVTPSGRKPPRAVTSGPKASLEITDSHLLDLMQLIAEFNLKPGDQEPDDPARPRFPRWLNPVVRIYSTQEPRRLVMPLAMWRPPAGLNRPYQSVMSRPKAYAKPGGVMLLDKATRAVRVLKHDRPLTQLGLHLCNQGQDLAQVRVRQGPWQSQVVTMYPGQELSLRLPPQAWPPTNPGYYPVSVAKLRGEAVVANLEWDPLILGRRALAEGNYREAAELLRQAIILHKGGFDAQVLLAGALIRLGDLAGAEGVVLSLGKLGDDPLASYRRLALPGEEPADWDQLFARFTGYHPQLLRQATSRLYRMAGPVYLAGQGRTTLRGRGYHGSYVRTAQDKSTSVRLWLNDLYPRGPWRADIGLVLSQGVTGQADLARVEVWAHHSKGSFRLGQQVLKASHFTGNKAHISLEMYNHLAWAEVEIRLVLLTDAPLRLEQVRMGMGIMGHMRSILRWYDEARGQVALKAGRAAEAVGAFESLLELDPGFSPVYLPLAHALLESGKKGPALQRVKQAEKVFYSNPAELSQVLKLYKALGRPQDLARVTKRLAHLRPSLGRQASFACGITLLGYDLPQNQVKRGGQLTVNYYWLVRQPPPVNYAVFVHLVGPKRRFTFDHYLDHNRRPMDKLKPGQVVREDYQIKIPADTPPGEYHLVLGLWDPRFTGKRVEVVRDQEVLGDQVSLTTIEVR